MKVFLKKVKERSFPGKLFGTAITAPGDTNPSDATAWPKIQNTFNESN